MAQGYVCPQCSMKFDKRKSMLQHFKAFNHGLRCPLCKLPPYPTLAKAAKHCRKNHEREQVFACVPCAKVFVDPTAFDAHNANHSVSPVVMQSPSQGTAQAQPCASIATWSSIACLQCGDLQCSSLAELITNQCDLSDPTTVCSICGQRPFDIITHMSDKHRKCLTCQATCLDVNTHYELSHPSLFCMDCRSPCVSEQALLAHQQFDPCLGSLQDHIQIPGEAEALSDSPGHIPHSSRTRGTANQPQNQFHEGSGLSSRTAETTSFSSPPTIAQTLKEEDHSALPTAFLNKLVAHFIEEFRVQYNKDLSSDEHALQQLRVACQSIRDTPCISRTIGFDKLFDGIDFRITFTYSQYEKLWNSCRDPKPTPYPDTPQPTTLDTTKVPENIASSSEQVPAAEAVLLPEAPDNNDWEVLSDLSYWSDIVPLADNNDLLEPDGLARGSVNGSAHSWDDEIGVPCFLSDVSISPPASTLSIPRMDDVGSGRESRAPSSDVPPTPPAATFVLDKED